MQYLFIFVAIVAVFVNYILANPSIGWQGISLTPTTTIEKGVEGTSTAKVSTGGTKEQLAPGFLLDTFIISGPKDGEIVATTTNITFKFNGITTPAQEDKVSYETKIIGLDQGWQSTNSNERTVEFPVGDREYTFLVRAKVGGFYDTTPAETTFEIKSSLNFGKIKISSVSKDLIILNSNLGADEKIDITGWKIVSKDNEFVIPQGIENYLGDSFVFSDILTKPGMQIYIESTSTPAVPLDRAFLPNKCFGYLPAFSEANLLFSYPKICPSINRNDICDFSRTCQDIILQLTNCSLLTSSQLLPLIEKNTDENQACLAYIENYTYRNLNYSGCLANYTGDSNFLGNTWYIFAGLDVSCKSGRNIIYLYDQKGLLVDKYDSGCVY